MAEANPQTVEEAQTPEPSPVEQVAESNGTVKVREKAKAGTRFPYNNLDDGVKVARAIFEIAGQQTELITLAAKLGHGSHSTGAFRLKVDAAKVFGLIEIEKNVARLTDIGTRLIDPNTESIAMVQAFLAVPLFKALYERYRGKVLPLTPALETEIVTLGGVPKQKDRARQIFLKSAEQAGLFAFGKEKLILPAGITEQMLTLDAPPRHRETHVPAVVESNSNGLDPRVNLLVATLPSPGADWSVEARHQWHVMADAIFDQMFGKISS